VEFAEATLIVDKKVIYCKQVARHHSSRSNGDHAEWDAEWDDRNYRP